MLSENGHDCFVPASGANPMPNPNANLNPDLISNPNSNPNSGSCRPRDLARCTTVSTHDDGLFIYVQVDSGLCCSTVNPIICTVLWSYTLELKTPPIWVKTKLMYCQKGEQNDAVVLVKNYMNEVNDYPLIKVN